MLRSHVIWAVFKRNVASYFSGVLGYLFIVVFVVAGSLLAFRPEFFATNQANLDQLTAWYPLLLMFIIPAVTMTAWADERKLGTDELLFTLPATDLEILLAKYLAVLAVYSAALAFSLTQAAILAYLGDPDGWQIASTYLGYWLAGAALIGAGLFASVLTNNATVAFVLGALICAIPVGLELIPGLPDWIRALTISAQLQDFTVGMIPISGLIYFVSLAGFMLYLNVVLIGRRHWGTGSSNVPLIVDVAVWAATFVAFLAVAWKFRDTSAFLLVLCIFAGCTLYAAFALLLGAWPGRHFAARTVALAAALISVNFVATQAAGRIDMTQEGLFTLSDTTYEVLDKVDSETPVTILAYLSPDVPDEYADVHRRLTGLLRQLDAEGGAGVQVQINFTDPTSEEADVAEQAGIASRQVQSERGGKISVEEILMGAVIQGPYSEVVVPFFDLGTPLEYELTRSIGTVINAERLKIGILTTDAKLSGGLNMHSFSQDPEWRIVQELKKQYDIVEVLPDHPIDEDVAVLIAVSPSSMTEPQMRNFMTYVESGEPVLIFDDPLPTMSFSLAPLQPKPPQGGGMMGMQQPSEPKAEGGRLVSLMAALGTAWEKHQPSDPDDVAGEDFIVFDEYNPHIEYADIWQPEILFITPKSGTRTAFNPDHVVTSGLQEAVSIFSGTIRPRDNDDLEFTPLLRTGADSSGLLDWSELIEPSFFGGISMNPNPRRVRDEFAHVIAAEIKSKEGSDKKIHAIFVADVDIISDPTFRLVERQMLDLTFDNVTFVLNAVDYLAGDEDYLALRKRRPQLRTLEEIDKEKDVFKNQLNEKIEQAEKEAQERLDAAQERLDNAVKAIEEDESLDPATKEQLKRLEQQRAQRRFDEEQREIEQSKTAEIKRERDAADRNMARIERNAWLAGVLLPPIPALLLMAVVLSIRLMNETVGVSPDRLVQR